MMNESEFATIEGTITLADGTVSNFNIGESGMWHQWGANTKRLGRTVVHMDAIFEGLMESDLLNMDA